MAFSCDRYVYSVHKEFRIFIFEVSAETEEYTFSRLSVTDMLAVVRNESRTMKETKTSVFKKKDFSYGTKI